MPGSTRTRPRNSTDRKARPAHVRQVDQPSAQHQLLDLQRSAGNGRVGRLVAMHLQREGASGASTSLAPRFGRLSDLAEQWHKRDTAIRAWLGDHHVDLMIQTSLFTVLADIRRSVPLAHDMSTSEMSQLVLRYCKDNRLPTNFSGSQGASRDPNRLKLAALSGLSASVKFDVGSDKGKISLSASGVTTELSDPTGKEGVKSSVGPSGVGIEGRDGDTKGGMAFDWNGRAVMKVDHDEFHFKATMSEKNWSISLTIGPTGFPDLAKVGDIFRNGEAAFRQAAGEIGRGRSAESVWGAVTSHANDIKGAMTAASKIQKASKGHFSLQVKVTGPIGAAGVDTEADETPLAVTLNIVAVF